jgi:mitochondrial fission protein ELM1
MEPLPILILSDGRPGHYHLAEGVAAAISRRRPVDVQRVRIDRRVVAPVRVMAHALMLGVPPASVLRHGYTGEVSSIRPARLVISAGGETVAANAAAAHSLGADNIYCGTLKHIAPERFSLIVTSYDRFRDTPRHLVALKPSHIDPDGIPRRSVPTLAAGALPERLGLLIGGNSGHFHFDDADWRALYDLMTACAATGTATRWVVSTSRRTPDAVGDALAKIAARLDGPIVEFIDYRKAGPGPLPRLFAAVDGIVVTEDSSTMLSEAVCARLPVVGVSPVRHDFKDDEREYRAFLLRNNWCRALPLATATPEKVAQAMAAIAPLTANPLDELAGALAERLPRLFTPAAAGTI